MAEGKFLYKSASTGKFEEGRISRQDYETASKMGVTVSQIVNAKYSDADPQLGTAWEQGKTSSGIYVKGKPEYGIPSTTIRDAMNGDCMSQGGLFSLAGNTIAAPSVPKDGSATPASRLFLPQVLLEMVNETLIEDHNPELALFNSLIADSMSISGSVYVQPTIDITAPREHDSRPIGQNSLPRNLVSISAGQSARTIANQSVGLQIADQAMALSTLNLVSLIMAQQMEGEKFRTLWAELAQVVSGNPDAGESSLSPVGFKATYDSTAAANTITQEGLWQLLYDPDRKVNYDTLLVDISGYNKLLNRTGRPLMVDPRTSGVNTGNAGNYGIDPTIVTPANFQVGSVNKVMIVPSSVLGATNRMLFMDSRFGLRKVTNTLASYTAQQDMILQRSVFYRIDWGYTIHRLRSDTEGYLLCDYSNP